MFHFSTFSAFIKFSGVIRTIFCFTQSIRERHPKIPYIVISKPDYLSNDKEIQDGNEEKRKFIESFYEERKNDGDNNIYFIDGSAFFPKQHNLCCTADLCHPNDLGFSYMAEKIGNILAEVLSLTTAAN